MNDIEVSDIFDTQILYSQTLQLRKQLKNKFCIIVTGIMFKFIDLSNEESLHYTALKSPVGKC